MNQYTQTDAIFLDFSKAFDRVPHCRLLAKLSSLHIDSLTLSWIRNFLTLRRQYTVCGNYQSNMSDVISGVPQGTVLGPLLFLIYVNDLPDSISSKIRLFADDCVIYRQITNPDDHIMLQQDLNSISAWCDNWLMSLNGSKCKVVSFSRKQSLSLHSYLLYNSPLSVSTSYKYLGVHLSDNLSWSNHIDAITSSASKTLGYLRRNLFSAPPHLRKLAYETYVRPILEFASAVWNPHQKYLINQIESIQNRAARFITSTYSRQASVSFLKNSILLQPLEIRRTAALLCIIHKSRYSNPNVIAPLLEPPNRTSRRLTNSRSYKRIFGHTSAFNNSSLPRAIMHWNSLPDHITALSDPTAFRVAVLDFLTTI